MVENLTHDVEAGVEVTDAGNLEALLSTVKSSDKVRVPVHQTAFAPCVSRKTLTS